MTTLAIKNVGTLVTGDIKNPIASANTIIIEDGVIAKLGNEELLNQYKCDKTIDAKGITVTPGLIDSHVHPVVGDFTPRQNTLGFINSSLHGGVTTMISAGECHTPGRPKDVSGTKALAVLAHKSFKNERPGGVKLHGGALILEKGLTEKDFEELAQEGVWIVGEIGLGSIKKPEDAAPMVEWAKKYGFKTMMHTGGTSIPGSSTVTAEDVMLVKPDVVSHLNGGPTAIPLEEVKKLIDETDICLEMVQCGNFKVLKQAIQWLKEKNQLDRVILGNDSPSGSGIIPLGILRSVAFIASLAGVPGEQALCMATGNTARTYELNVGIIEEGREADLVLMDAPMGSVGDNAVEALEAGDLTGISMIIIDGKVVAQKSRNTPPPKRKAVLC
jgi:enamidase